MGQPITVVEQRSSRPGVMRFEINRPLTGMGHERYARSDVIEGGRPVDELARRLLATGQIEALHANGSVVTVDLAGGASGEGLADIIRQLFIHYREGVVPTVPTD
jgi:hypothetical protein